MHGVFLWIRCRLQNCVRDGWVSAPTNVIGEGGSREDACSVRGPRFAHERNRRQLLYKRSQSIVQGSAGSEGRLRGFSPLGNLRKSRARCESAEDNS